MTIRLIYFDTIRGRFQQTYAGQIAAGYAAIGLPEREFWRRIGGLRGRVRDGERAG